MRYVAGTQKVINNLMAKKNKVLAAIAEGVEKACVDVAAHAKAGHAGDMAHASKRYQNRTVKLTRSISPGLAKVGFDEVVGFVASDKEYAEFVEAIYPYMFPALQANRENFKKRLKESTRGVL